MRPLDDTWTPGGAGSAVGSFSTAVVTPEGVVLGFDTASAPSRAFALALDLLVAAGVVLAVGIVSSILASRVGPSWLPIPAIVTAATVMLLVVPAVCEARWRGRTLGKAAVGLRVVTVEGAPVAFRHTALRAALGLLDVWLVPVGGVGLITIWVSRRDQRLGDLAAGTLVLRTRTAARPFAAVAFPPPPGLEWFAAGLDVGQVTVEQYLVIRSFLLRAGELRPAGRAHVGTLLTRDVVAAIGRPVPPGVHPEAYLACVAHAYQRRSAALEAGVRG